jgi:hypothetical protein
MGDPTKAEPRNPTTGGETAQETVDRMGGLGGRDTIVGQQGSPHPATYPVMAKPPGPSTHPSASHTYGSPLGATVLRQRDGT